jgi:hypothetical protein
VYGRNPTPADHAGHIFKPVATGFFDAAARVAYATQNAPLAYRPRSHYCGLHGWNNDHNGPECRAMARDPKFTKDMRNATTHEGTGGNPKNVGVPVGYVRPPPFSWSPPLSLPTCLPCSRANTCLLSPSQVSSANRDADPYEDTCARASPASLMRPQSEGNRSTLVRESEAVLVSSPKVFSLPACFLTRPSPQLTSPATINPKPKIYREP